MWSTWERIVKESGPAHAVGWLAICIALALAYYPAGLYGWIEARYERGKWESCEDTDRTWCERESERENLRLLVRAPRYVSDFLEEPIELTLVNTGPDPVENAVVTLDLELVGDEGRSLDGYLRAGEDRAQTDSLVLHEIPGHSQVTRLFYLRVPRRHAGVIRASFRLNGEPFGPPFNVDMQFDRLWSLRLWAGQELLMPPGSNWLIVAIALLLLTLLTQRAGGERGTERLRMGRKYPQSEPGPPEHRMPVEHP